MYSGLNKPKERTMNITSKDIKRFLAKTKKENGCIIWVGARGKQGYGNFVMCLPSGKKYFRAHRFAYIAFRGPIEENKNVCHTCNNPSCVNPDHLYIGSQRDNLRQMDEQGRRVKRDYGRNAIVTEEQVLEIRQRCADGKQNLTALAREYGYASPNRIREIVQRKRWKHI